jgi:hypothetical protein
VRAENRCTLFLTPRWRRNFWPDSVRPSCRATRLARGKNDVDGGEPKAGNGINHVAGADYRSSPMRIYLQDYAALLGFTLSLLFILTIAFA